MIDSRFTDPEWIQKPLMIFDAYPVTDADAVKDGDTIIGYTHQITDEEWVGLLIGYPAMLFGVSRPDLEHLIRRKAEDNQTPE